MENIQMEGVDPCTDEAFSAEFEAMLDTHFVHAERAPDGSPAGLWLLGPEDKRADGDRPLRSYFRSVVTLLPCFTFRNVLWSTHDPKHGASSWIGLWRAKTGILNPSCQFSGQTVALLGEDLARILVDDILCHGKSGDPVL